MRQIGEVGGEAFQLIFKVFEEFICVYVVYLCVYVRMCIFEGFPLILTEYFYLIWVFIDCREALDTIY